MAAERNRKVAWSLVGVAGLMLGLSYAAVPFYDWFCRVTGYGGTTAIAAAPSGPVLDQTVVVRFDANVSKDMPWMFRPMQKSMTVRIGESALAFYEAHNPSDVAVAGQASYNVTPHQAGRHFDKIACFCFNMQVLQPGERIEMPVSFFVDPDMLADADAEGVRVITLSYTMYKIDVPAETAALSLTDFTYVAAKTPPSAQTESLSVEN